MKSHFTAIFLSVLLSLGTISAAWSADFQKGVAAAQSGDFATALREWTPLAKQGNADAQYFLGYMYDEGQGVPENDKTAVKWYTLAVAQGNSDADSALAALEETIEQMEQLKQLITQAERGDAESQYQIALMYESGKSVEKDLLTAISWAKKARSNDHLKGDELYRKLIINDIAVKQLIYDCPPLLQAVGKWGATAFGAMLTTKCLPIDASAFEANEKCVCANRSGNFDLIVHNSPVG